MKIRSEPKVASLNQVGSLPLGVSKEVFEIYEAGQEKWAKIDAGWVAIIHQGKQFGEVKGNLENTTNSEPIQNFPDSFTLVDPSGKKAFYQFVRVVE